MNQDKNLAINVFGCERKNKDKSGKEDTDDNQLFNKFDLAPLRLASDEYAKEELIQNRLLIYF